MKTAEQEEKQKAFLQRAKANLKNNDLHRALIQKHIEPLHQQPFRGSIQSFEESGHVSGSLMLALMEYAEAYASQSRWIAVEERLPEESDRYWCYVEEQNDLGLSHFQWNCYYDSFTKLWSDNFKMMCVTHYQPLPDKPTELREEEV